MGESVMKILRAESSTPSPRLTVCPSTFSAAGLWRARTLLVLLAVLSAVLLAAGNARAQGTVATDRAALVALYNATGGANWTDNTNWTSNEALSEWHGVVTDGEGRVKRLYLGHLVAPVPYRGGAKLGFEPQRCEKLL